MVLQNTRVIEFAGLAPGPFAGLILADWGADVVRVDRPGVRSVDLLCRHKRSIVLDVKSPDGIDVLRRLIARADVLIDPFRPGVMERIGLGPEMFLSEGGLNRRLVYARLAGFAHTDAAGHDINYLALSGVLSMFPGSDSKPSFPLNLVADFAGGGLTCALGILLALLERHTSGLGQVVATNMVSGTRYVSTFPLLSALGQPSPSLSFRPFPTSPPASSNHPVTRMSNTLDGGAPFYNVYTCADGRWFSLGCLEPRFYAVFLERFLATLPDEFLKAQDLKLTVENQYETELWPRMKIFFERAFRLFGRDHWTRVFENSDACGFPVLSPAESATLEASSYSRPTAESAAPPPHPHLSRTPALSPPVHGDGDAGLLDCGRHTVEVLRELGLSVYEIESLDERGVFGGEKQGSSRDTRAKTKL